MQHEANITPANLMASAKPYLDLMEKCILGTIYKDPATASPAGQVYDDALRKAGRDWPSKAHTMVGEKRLRNARQMAELAILQGIPGDFIETGVWRGGASIMMRAVCEAYGVKDRNVILCDSFEGLPAPDPAFPEDAGDTLSEYKELAIPVEKVAANFDSYGLLDDQVKFVKGWFKDTMPTIKGQFAVVRLDGDLYESTIQTIEALYPQLSEGGYLIVDDYGAVPGCKKAIHDYREAHGITDKIYPIDWTGVWWEKGSGAK